MNQNPSSGGFWGLSGLGLGLGLELGLGWQEETLTPALPEGEGGRRKKSGSLKAPHSLVTVQAARRRVSSVPGLLHPRLRRPLHGSRLLLRRRHEDAPRGDGPR